MSDQPPPFLILSDAVLSGMGIATDDIVARINDALQAQARGDVWSAPKAAMLPGDGRYMMTTLSSSDTPQLTVVKSVMVSPRNPARGLNGVEGAILLQDSETGDLLAIMQAGWVTTVRTAGLSCVAARALARPQSQILGLVGAGQQARGHLVALADLFPLQQVRIFGRGQANIDRLSRMASDLGLTPVVCDTVQEAVEDADIVVSSVTLSYDADPFVDAHWLKAGAFAAITDAATPWHREKMGAFGRIIIDDLEQERENPRKMVDPDLVQGDLAGLVGQGDQPRPDPDKPSAFVFRGMAIGDFAIASLAYEKARALNIGKSARW